MNVLSIFDGMSCGMLALLKAGIKVDKYFSSEIDKYAIKISNKNYPEIIQLGNVENLHYINWGLEIDKPQSSMRVIETNIDLLLGGSPCQGLSFNGTHLNFKDPRSVLVFEYARLLKEIQVNNPDVIFLLENVKMKKEHQKVISDLLGVQPMELNSSLVSGQMRNRLYWTNIKGIEKPQDKNICFQDILQSDFARKQKAYAITASYF